MIGLLQRVRHAEVEVGDETVAAIGAGLLVLVGIERGDDAATGRRLLERLLGYRVFADSAGRMNHSLRQTGGGLLLVPQFTLLADTRKGSRPGFAALLATARALHTPVAAGIFGADMQVSLCNDGPVTFQLAVPPGSRP